jgi:hypothetical protein
MSNEAYKVPSRILSATANLLQLKRVNYYLTRIEVYYLVISAVFNYVKTRLEVILVRKHSVLDYNDLFIGNHTSTDYGGRLIDLREEPTARLK